MKYIWASWLQLKRSTGFRKTSFPEKTWNQIFKLCKVSMLVSETFFVFVQKPAAGKKFVRDDQKLKIYSDFRRQLVGSGAETETETDARSSFDGSQRKLRSVRFNPSFFWVLFIFCSIIVGFLSWNWCCLSLPIKQCWYYSDCVHSLVSFISLILSYSLSLSFCPFVSHSLSLIIFSISICL